jgi:hypothetical protein
LLLPSVVADIDGRVEEGVGDQLAGLIVPGFVIREGPSPAAAICRSSKALLLRAFIEPRPPRRLSASIRAQHGIQRRSRSRSGTSATPTPRLRRRQTLANFVNITAFAPRLKRRIYLWAGDDTTARNKQAWAVERRSLVGRPGDGGRRRG